MQEMSIYGVSFDMVGKQPIVLLRTLDGSKFLPIWIVHPEAAAILMKLQGTPTPRPMTHDLVTDMLGELNAKVEKIAVTELRDNTFYASITLRIDGVEKDPLDADGEAFLYEASVRDPTEGDWKPFCLPDRDGKNRAIPLHGSWDASPRDGTLVAFYDRLGIQRRAPAPGMVFEAAWSPRGAVYVNKTRYGGENLEEIVAECPDRLRGRTGVDEPIAEPPSLMGRWQNALIISESRVTGERP